MHKIFQMLMAKGSCYPTYVSMSVHSLFSFFFWFKKKEKKDPRWDFDIDGGISSLENVTHLAPLCQLLLKHSRTPQTVTPHRKSSKTSTENRGSGEERTDAVRASTMVPKALSHKKSQMILTVISRVCETVTGWSWGRFISVQRTLLNGALSFMTWFWMTYVRFQMLKIWE